MLGNVGQKNMMGYGKNTKDMLDGRGNPTSPGRQDGEVDRKIPKKRFLSAMPATSTAGEKRVRQNNIRNSLSDMNRTSSVEHKLPLTTQSQPDQLTMNPANIPTTVMRCLPSEYWKFVEQLERTQHEIGANPPASEYGIITMSYQPPVKDKLPLFQETKPIIDTRSNFNTQPNYSQLLDSSQDLVDDLEQPAKLDYTRLLVLRADRDRDGLSLTVYDPLTSNKTKLRVHQDWSDDFITAGKYIHIVLSSGTLDDETTIGNEDLVVVDPDEMVAITSVADSFQCIRRTLLKQKIKRVGCTSEPMVHGNITHELFQRAMAANNFRQDWLQGQLVEIIESSTEDLYSIGSDEKKCEDALMPSILQIISWKEKNYLINFSNPSNDIKVVRSLDIEERVQSHKYGLKGFIDVTAQYAASTHIANTIVPLELKTGKSMSESHRAQTSLYTMILADRRHINVDKGLLVYLGTNDTQVLTSNQSEKRALIMGRNRVVHYMTSGKMPPMLDNPSTCKRCFVAQECMIYHKSLEGGKPSGNGLDALFNQHASFITPRHIQFIQHWEAAIKLEESKSDNLSKNIWNTKPDTRELLGTCITGLRIVAERIDQVNTRFQYHYDLSRPVILSQGTHSNHSHLTEGDPIILTGHLSAHPLGIGFLGRITAEGITISIDKALEDGAFLASQSLAFSQDNGGLRFTIDKDVYSSGQGTIRGNLFELFQLPDCHRRALIVDLVAPIFDLLSADYVNEYKQYLNQDQLNALLKVASCRDYALILGMPGTGKTTIIAYMIKMLISHGKQILLTSYTHSAVDNVLLKLVELKIDFIRLGSLDKMHPKIKKLTQASRRNLAGVASLSEYYGNTRVVATTALGINQYATQDINNSSIFSKRRFDYCIVDESSQIALPVCLGPLQYAEKFVLVGDHYQLSPIFAQDENKTETLSLFKHLSQAYPQAIASLQIQYRMNRDIMNLTNHLIYDYRLKCGSPEVEKKSLSFPLLTQWDTQNHLESLCYGKCWIKSLLDPKVSVAFCDTDLVPAVEQKSGPFIENPIEAKLVLQLVTSMIEAGLSESDIGVICPYRHQLKKISKVLTSFPEIEILTIDKSQGRDKKCIIVSMTRSNSNQQAGELMKDWQRLNVAITRAKQKLILLGSLRTLGSSGSFREMFELMGSKGWILKLPKDAHLFHPAIVVQEPLWSQSLVGPKSFTSKLHVFPQSSELF